MLIRPEAAKAMTARQECEIVRGALQQAPASALLRLRLAKLFNQLDAFDETVALLTTPEAGVLGHHELLALAAAYFARETMIDSWRACDAAERALELSVSDAERAAALADRAKALFRVGKPDAACDLLTRALRLDPQNRIACKRMAVHLLRLGDAGAVIALTDRLAAQGVGHARLLAARVIAFAKLGQIDVARNTVNLREFSYRQLLSPPAGWKSLQSFNAALADELSKHPGIRYERYGTSSRKTWRIETPVVGAAPAARALLARIVETAVAHLATLSVRHHPWLAARPEKGALRSWCVITEGDGFEDWHMHPFGWMSGVYYVQVPGAVDRGADAGGCIAFGLPSGLIGEDAAHKFGADLVRPHAGLLVLFPSHAYHRTFPHGDEGRRIGVAFDIMPE
jgi:tetratricopeptide (TPR) repeat protein